MTRIANSPFEWLEFDAAGDISSDETVERTNSALANADADDLVIISHGWRNDRKDAEALYATLWTNTAQRLPEFGKDPSKYIVAGVSWPAIKFRDPFDLPATGPNGEQFEAEFNGNGAVMSVDGSIDNIDLRPAEFHQVLDDFVSLADSDEARRARVIAADYADQMASADALVEAVLGALQTKTPDEEEAAYLTAFDNEAGDILGALAAPPMMGVMSDLGQAQGLGDTLTNLISGPRAAAARLFSYATYYTMKKRAGIVGASLGRNILPRLKSERPLRLHFIGHSFGARLVTAAIHGSPENLPSATRQTLIMLQGAFSHNALAAPDGHLPGGAFEGAQHKVQGPVAITHTHNDKAVTLAYALASRIVRDNTRAIGDSSDEFGAMGANGAQGIDADCSNPPIELSVGGDYILASGKVHNVKADACISDHADVTNPQVARLVAAAIA